MIPLSNLNYIEIFFLYIFPVALVLGAIYILWGVHKDYKKGIIVTIDFGWWIPRWSDLKLDLEMISVYINKTWNREWGWLKIKEIILGILYLPFFLNIF